MAEIASAYISLIPSLRGAQREIQRQMGPIGQRTGEQFGEDFNDAASSEINSSSGLGSIASKGGGFGSDFGKKFGAAAAVGITAIVGASIKSAIDQEADSDRTAAALGANPREAARLGKLAGRIYGENFGENFGDVTSAIDAVRSSFRSLGTGKDLKKVTEQALNFADIFQIDVPRAISVSQTVVQSGLAKDATNALDLLTASAQKVPAALREDILDAANEYGGFFKQIGIGGPQAFGLLVEGAKQGEFGIDKTGDAVAEFSKLVTGDIARTKPVIKSLGLEYNDTANALLKGGKKAGEATNAIVDGLLAIKNPAKQTRLALELFGTPLEDLGTRNIPRFLKTLKGSEKPLGKFAGAIDRAGVTANDNASRNIEAFKRQVTQTFVNLIGKKVLPFITDFALTLSANLKPVVDKVRDALAKVSPILSNVGDFLQKNREYVKAFGIGLAVVATAIGAVTLATTLFSIALNSTGIPLVIFALAALVGGLYLAYQRSATFRAVVDEVGAALKDFASFVKTDVAPVVIDLGKKIAVYLKPILKQLGTTFREDVLPLVLKFIQKFREAQPTIQKVIGAIIKIIAKCIEFEAAVLSKVLPALIRFAGFIIRNVVPAVARFIADIKRSISFVVMIGRKVFEAGQAFGKFANAAKNKVGELLSFLGTVPLRVVSFVGDLGKTLLNAGRQLVQGLIDGVTEKIGDLKKKVSDLAGIIKVNFPGSPVKDGPLKSWNYGNGVSGAGRKLADGLGDGIAARTKAVKDKASKLAQAIVNSFKTAFNDLRNASKELASSIADAFRPDLLSGNLADLFSTGQQSKGALTQVIAAFKKLRKFGLSAGFISDLYASGNTGLILELASGDKATAKAAQRLVNQNNNLADSLGSKVAGNEYAPQFDNLANRFDKAIDRLGNRADKQSAKLARDLAAAINGAAVRGRRNARA